MSQVQEHVLLLRLIQALERHGSWAGETHVQKAMYILQEGLKTDSGHSFVMYKHGPFSFDLREGLGQLSANGYIAVRPRPAPYGPSLAVNMDSATLEGLDDLDACKVEYISRHLGKRGVAELERLATALYVQEELPEASPQERLERLRQLKPHIPVSAATLALEEIQEFIDNFHS